MKKCFVNERHLKIYVRVGSAGSMCKTMVIDRVDHGYLP